MSTIITVNALEQNVGVSSTVLTLSEKLNFLTKKNTCIVELDHQNPSFSYVLEKSSIGNKSIDGLISFINNDTVIDDDLIDILKFNVKTFKNSNIDIIYGSKDNRRFNNIQLNIFITVLREKYENIIIDYGNEIIPDVLIDNSDINILLVQPSLRYIDLLGKNKKDYIHKKTTLLIDNNIQSSSEIAFLVKDKFKDTELLGQLPLSKDLMKSLSQGTINIEKGIYSKSLTKIALKICSQLSIDIKVKNTFTDRILGKIEEREEDVFINLSEKTPLGEILVNEKICTLEDIEKCLKIQAKRLG